MVSTSSMPQRLVERSLSTLSCPRPTPAVFLSDSVFWVKIYMCCYMWDDVWPAVTVKSEFARRLIGSLAEKPKLGLFLREPTWAKESCCMSIRYFLSKWTLVLSQRTSGGCNKSDYVKF